VSDASGLSEPGQRPVGQGSKLVAKV
jgi:hypothetical protein